MSDKELRVGHVSDLEVRQDGEARRLVGHAAVFDQLSENLGGFREKISRGAFSSSLEADVRALVNHDSSRVLGRTSAGTMRIAEDDVGLRVEIEPPETSYARDLMASVERGDVSQMSFGFRVRAGGQSFDEDESGTIIRTLTDVELLEVSPVTFPAYPQTDVALRSIESWKQETVPDSGLLPIPTDHGLSRMKAIRDSILAKERRDENWYEIRDEGAVSEPAEILIYDAIGLYGADAQDFVGELKALDGRDLHIRLNSPGGSVFDGAAIYNALRRHRGRVTVDIDGIAASMASIIAAAGEHVRINQNAFVMIHNASGCVMGDCNAMRHEADLLEKINRSLAKTLAIRSGHELEEIVGLMNRETWFDADEALELGLADEVMHGGPANLRHHDLGHFRNVPDRLKEVRRVQARQARLQRRHALAERIAR